MLPFRSQLRNFIKKTYFKELAYIYYDYHLHLMHRSTFCFVHYSSQNSPTLTLSSVTPFNIYFRYGRTFLGEIRRFGILAAFVFFSGKCLLQELTSCHAFFIYVIHEHVFYLNANYSTYSLNSMIHRFIITYIEI